MRHVPIAVIRERQRRAHEPLARFVGFAAAAALDPFRGLHNDPGLLEHAALAVRAELERHADAGAFLYFGITDAFELHAERLSCDVGEMWARDCPVCRDQAWAKLAHARKCGHITVDAYTIASEIIYGPSRQGWIKGSAIAAADLEPRR